jgi:hypothetical protein
MTYTHMVYDYRHTMNGVAVLCGRVRRTAAEEWRREATPHPTTGELRLSHALFHRALFGTDPGLSWQL